MLMFLPQVLQSGENAVVNRDNFASYVMATRALSPAHANREWIPQIVAGFSVVHNPGGANTIAPIKPVCLLTTDLKVEAGVTASLTQ
jgi:hypothetical protein